MNVGVDRDTWEHGRVAEVDHRRSTRDIHVRTDVDDVLSSDEDDLIQGISHRVARAVEQPSRANCDDVICYLREIGVVPIARNGKGPTGLRGPFHRQIGPKGCTVVPPVMTSNPISITSQFFQLLQFMVSLRLGNGEQNPDRYLRGQLGRHASGHYRTYIPDDQPVAGNLKILVADWQLPYSPTAPRIQDGMI